MPLGACPGIPHTIHFIKELISQKSPQACQEYHHPVHFKKGSAWARPGAKQSPEFAKSVAFLVSFRRKFHPRADSNLSEHWSYATVRTVGTFPASNQTVGRDQPNMFYTTAGYGLLSPPPPPPPPPADMQLGNWSVRHTLRNDGLMSSFCL